MIREILKMGDERLLRIARRYRRKCSTARSCGN